MSELPGLERIYTVPELADYLKVSHCTVVAIIDSGRLKSLPNLSSGTKHRIRRVTHSDLVEFLQQKSEPKIREKGLPLPSPSQRRLKLSK